MNINDPAVPNSIWARNPNTAIGKVLLSAEPSTIRFWIETFGSAAKMGEFAGLVHGRWQEPEGTVLTLSGGLQAPKAIFKGLRRPLFCNEDDDDRNIYIYITNPKNTYNYPRNAKFSGGQLERLPPPINSVFATYVTFHKSFVDELSVDVSEHAQPAGLVVGWEWMEQSSKTPALPYDYDTRFESRVY